MNLGSKNLGERIAAHAASAALQRWRSYAKPMVGTARTIGFERRLTKGEITAALEGWLPLDTDERWFGLILSDGIALCRAHSGQQIYRFALRQEADGWVAGPLEVVDVATVYRSGDDAFELATAGLLLERMLASA